MNVDNKTNTDDKLWNKNQPLDRLIEKFTVGDDYKTDVVLVIADCVASLAHANMLQGQGLITRSELIELKEALLIAIEKAEQDQFIINRKDEDVHTALENFISNKTAAGAKIHTGRSRNDQIMAALRLYGRSGLNEIRSAVLRLTHSLLTFATKYETVLMPGRTHTQIAMPSSLGLWASSFAEGLLDDLLLIKSCYELTDRSPLGSGAGYGVPLSLNREQIAKLLGFSCPIHNVLSASNSRGKLESITIDAIEQIALTLSRMAEDIILFSLPELGYFSLPVELCTGSSIMPQKRNPDGLELVRAKSAIINGLGVSVKSVLRNLPSGYSRDLQETKKPYLSAFDIILGQLVVIDLTISKLEINKENLKNSITPELFATDYTFREVQGGTPFREAYRLVAENLEESKNSGIFINDLDEKDIFHRRSSTGSLGKLELSKCKKIIEEEKNILNIDNHKIKESFYSLVGRDVKVFDNYWGKANYTNNTYT